MEQQWLKTHCGRFDHGGCGLKVLKDGDRIVRILPDGDDPRSRGYACPKGLAGIERLYHPQRLLHPLKREGERGQGRWKRISWDQALEEIAEGLLRMKEEHGPGAVAFAQGAPKGLEYFLLMRLANVFGTPNLVTTGHVCHWPRELMGRVTCGFWPDPDYGHPTRMVLVWGSNPYHTNEEGILGVQLKRSLIRHRPSLVVIDPYRTEIAKEADLWLQVRPGADDLLALGMLHVIVNEGLYDTAFVQDWAKGFEALKAHVQPFTPRVVSEGTWVPKEKIRLAARRYAEAKPATLHWGNALENSGTNVSQTCRALLILMAVTGNLDVPGGNIEASVPPVMSLRKLVGGEHLPEEARRAMPAHYGIFSKIPFLPSSLLVRAVLEEAPYAIRGLFVQGSNPLITYADSKMVLRALQKLDLLVVSEVFMTPTAAMADMVLPAATSMEFHDIGHYGLPHGHVFARPRIVHPRGECRPDMEIINELAKRLGLAELFWEDTHRLLDDILAPSGLSYEAFCEAGVLEGEKRYRKYAKRGFRTPSEKVEIYSTVMEREGFPPLPTAAPQPDRCSPYPLILSNAKPRHFFHSAYRHLGSLRERHGEPKIRIHPRTAAAHGIETGDDVAVISPRGWIRLKAHLTESLHPDVVKADYGWWFPERGQEGLFGWNRSNVNVLTSGNPPYDPVLGTTPLKSIPCRIRKVSGEGEDTATRDR